MFLEIPINTAQPDHEFSIELDSVVVVLHFRFNVRSNRWFMNIKQEDGTEILSGIPLVVTWPLVQRFQDERLPPGEFFVIDLTRQDAEPAQDSFGSTHVLVYAESGTEVGDGTI